MAKAEKGEKNIGSRINNTIASVITLGTFITIIFGGFFWFEDHYASAAEVTEIEENFEIQIAELEKRFEIKVKNDILRETQARIWQLDERLQKRPDDITAKEDLKALEEYKKKIQRELDALGS